MSKFKICFSIAVHENEDCVKYQADNILKVCPNSCVVFHVNPYFMSYEDAVKKFQRDRIYINSTQYPITWGDGLLFSAYLSNLKLAMSTFKFDYFWMDNSKTIYYNPQLEDYITQFDFSLWGKIVELTDKNDWRSAVYNDQELNSIIKLLPKDMRLMGPSEGMFFSCELASYLIGICDKYDFSKQSFYPREESIFQTILFQEKFSYTAKTCPPLTQYLFDTNFTMNRISLRDFSALTERKSFATRFYKKDDKMYRNLFKKLLEF
jgi:hypothetical protein